MKPADRLAKALKAHPPSPRGGSVSILDREDLLEVLRAYLEGLAAGEEWGAWPWFHEHIVQGEFQISTSAGNVKRFAQSRYPELYKRAMRRGQ